MPYNVIYVLGLSLISCRGCRAVHLESDRIIDHNTRNYTWPPAMVPSTEGWSNLMSRRFDQISQMSAVEERWEAYVQIVNSAYTVNNYTENGWGIIRAPDGFVEELRTAVREGIENDQTRDETEVQVIEGPTSKFIHRLDLMDKALRVLKPLHEKWAGVPLVGNNAYGFRLYQNGSSLNMHVDKPETHVISSILHVDRSADAENWPIVIEDFQGNTNEVFLEPGDMLFYESSKCLHGRPKVFNGSWYTSIFIHYYPVGWDIKARIEEARIGVPLHWSESFPCDNNPKALSGGLCDERDTLQMVGTSMKEPQCESKWCAIADAVQWHGPTKKHHLTTSTRVSPFTHDEL